MDINEMNRNVIEEFRANKGVVGGNFEGFPLLLLKATGAKSGEERTKPLAYWTDGDRLVVIASFAGAPANPPWFHNVKQNPNVGVEVGEEQYQARAEIIAEPERTEMYAKIVEAMPIFGEYQEKTERVIPLVALNRVG